MSSTATSIERAARTWAGGPGGRAVLNKVLDAIPAVLTPAGVAYVLFFEEEAFAAAGLEARGWHFTKVAEYRAKGETFLVVRIAREVVPQLT